MELLKQRILQDGRCFPGGIFCLLYTSDAADE